VPAKQGIIIINKIVYFPEKPAPTKPKASGPLSMDDSDDDDFFGKPKPPPLSASPTPSPKPKTGPSLFSDEDDESSILGASAQATKPSIRTTSKPKTDLFSNEEEESSGPPPLSASPMPSPKPSTKPKTGPSLFSDEEEDTAKSTGPLPSKAKAGPSLFSDDDEDLFSGASKAPSTKAVDNTDSEKPRPKKPAGAVSMFGGVDLFGGGTAKSVEKKGDEMPKKKGNSCQT